MNEPQLKIVKIDESQDDTGHPICTVHYRLGLSESQMVFDGERSSLDMSLIRQILNTGLPLNPKFAFDYYFQKSDLGEIVDACNDILFENWVINEELEPEQNILDTFDEEFVAECKRKLGEYWSVEIAARYVMKTQPIYSEVFYAALYLHEFYVSQRGFKAGYLAAEMNLKFKHEDDVEVRRKAKRALGTDNAGRSFHNAQKKRKAREWHAHASKVLERLDAKGTKSSIASSIISHWDKVGDDLLIPACPKKKTIQNWLSG